jgi:drug/metabolite transporter (DMT)-like permease
MSAHTPPTSRVVALLIGLLCLIWGSTWIVIAGGLQDLPPFTSAAARFLLAALTMSLLAPHIARREGGTRPPLGLSAVVGALNFAASYALVYWSETKLPSGLVAVLWAVYPLMMAISGRYFLAGERVGARQAVGFVAAFAGVVLLFTKDLERFGRDGIAAAALLLLSPAVSCVGTVVLKRRGAGFSSAYVNRDAMWVGALLLSLLALALERDVDSHWSAAAIASVAYLALIGTVLTFTLYFWLLRHTQAYRMSMIAYITPAIALTLGTLIGKEELTRWMLAGSALILVGVLLVTWRTRARA